MPPTDVDQTFKTQWVGTLVETDYEYLLSQELDGTLSPEDAVVLREAVARDPELAKLRDEYHRLESGLDLLAVDKHIDFAAMRSNLQREVRRQSLLGSVRTPLLTHLLTPLRIAAGFALLASVAGALVMTGKLGSVSGGPDNSVAVVGPESGPQLSPRVSPELSPGSSPESSPVVRIELADLPAQNVPSIAAVSVESPTDFASADAAMLHEIGPDASAFRVLISPGVRSARDAGRGTSPRPASSLFR